MKRPRKPTQQQLVVVVQQAPPPKETRFCIADYLEHVRDISPHIRLIIERHASGEE